MQSVQAVGGIRYGSAPCCFVCGLFSVSRHALGERPVSAGIVLFSPPARGPASETQIRKDGTFFKKGVCAILAVPFPIADFLCFDNSRVRTQIVKWVEGEGSSQR